MSTILPTPVKPYPLATKSQEVVPNEIAAPAGCYRVVLQTGASYVLENLPARVPVIAIAASAPALAVFSNDTEAPSVAQGELIGGGMICPAGVTSVYKPDTHNLILINESTQENIVYVQLLHTWNILGTDHQVTRI